LLVAGVKRAQSARLPNAMGNAPDKIPAEVAKELRTLAHDLSNALETILQATYLISEAGPPESSRRWVELLEQASQDAVKINQKLREVLRSQS
jgi:hypothetical protein